MNWPLIIGFAIGGGIGQILGMKIACSKITPISLLFAGLLCFLINLIVLGSLKLLGIMS